MLIIGAKGHAKEVLEILHNRNETINLCFYDDYSKDIPLKLYDQFHILKTETEARKYFSEVDNCFHLGIGNPILRKKMYDKFYAIGFRFISLISPYSNIGSFDVQIEEGCTIASGVTITNSVQIKRGCLINRNVSISHDCKIGEFVELCPGVTISGSCEIGSFTQIGTGAIVIPNIKIGSNVIIAAGAVVTKDIPDNCMVAGIPASIKKELTPLNF